MIWAWQIADELTKLAIANIGVVPTTQMVRWDLPFIHVPSEPAPFLELGRLRTGNFRASGFGKRTSYRMFGKFLETNTRRLLHLGGLPEPDVTKS
jgi:hypothetical protein